MYVDYSFTNVGRRTSYIRGTRYRMMKFECRGVVVEFIEIMYETCVILRIQKYISFVDAMIHNMIKLHKLTVYTM